MKDEFPCLGPKCPASCCGPFTGPGQGRLKPMDGVDFSSVPLDYSAIVFIQQCFMSDRIYQVNGRWYIKLNYDNSCPFHDKEGLCEIYDHRPPVCRAYPYYLDPHAGLCFDSNCPVNHKKADHVLDGEIEALKQAYQLILEKS